MAQWQMFITTPTPPCRPLHSSAKLQSGIVTKFSKKMGAHGLTTTLGWIKGVREDSIEYASEKASVRGWALAAMLLFVPRVIGTLYLVVPLRAQHRIGGLFG